MTTPSFQESLPVEWVTADIIRQEFNKHQFWQKAQSGELKATIKRDKHPEKPPYGHPVCTRKQFLVYYTLDGNPVAWVHQLLLPDGSLGASGIPDPKRLFIENRILAVRSNTSS